jgi:hypothetical protein
MSARIGTSVVFAGQWPPERGSPHQTKQKGTAFRFRIAAPLYGIRGSAPFLETSLSAAASHLLPQDNDL